MTSLGCTVWFTGLSGSGKTTCARDVVRQLAARGRRVELLDGDEIRETLSAGLGFSRADRDANVRRIGYVCELLTRNGVIACAAAISPYDAVREELRRRIGRFVLVHCDAPLDVLEQRDVKGLYRQARSGRLGNLTGIGDPYEPPDAPDVVVRSDRESVAESAARVIDTIGASGYLDSPASDLARRVALRCL